MKLDHWAIAQGVLIAAGSKIASDVVDHVKTSYTRYSSLEARVAKLEAQEPRKVKTNAKRSH